jgi:hypothetical protein
LPVTRFATPPGYVVSAMREVTPERFESFAAGRGMSVDTARNAFRVFYLPIAQLREENRTVLEPVHSGWCYLQQGDRGFEVVEIFEPRQAGAEWVRHWFGDGHPMAGAVAGTLAPTFSTDIDYELRLLLVTPLLPPALWIVPPAGGVEWIMAPAGNIEEMVSGMWYDIATFAELLRTEVRRFNWEILP